MGSRVALCVALTVSVLLHGSGIAMLHMPKLPEPMELGAGQVQVGASFSDLSVAVDPVEPQAVDAAEVPPVAEPIEPTPMEPQEMPPVQPSSVQPVVTAPAVTEPLAPVVAVPTPSLTPSVPVAAPQVLSAPQSETLEPQPDDGSVKVAPLPRARPRDFTPPEPQVQPQRRQPQAERRPARTNTTAQTAAPSRSSQPQRVGNANEIQNFYSAVQRKIARTRVRSRARGTAQVRFRLTASGALAGASIVRSSGNAQLDAAALSAVRGAAPFPRPPEGADLTFTLPVRGR